MSLFDVLRYRLRVLSRPRAHEREVAEEVEFHVDLEAMQQRHAASGGLSPSEARDAARRRFGNATYYREEARRISGLAVLDTLMQDVRFASRTLRRAPTFTVVAVLTLAIGIGANTAIFSAVDALLLRPLPFREPGRLMSVGLTLPGSATNPRERVLPWSYPKLEALRAGQRVFSSITAWTVSTFTLRAGDDAVRMQGEYVDSRYLPTLGVAPWLGRNFRGDEDRLDAPSRVAILGYDVWRNMFNADSSVMGRSFDVDGVPFTVVGVMPRGFSGVSGDVSFWMPIAASPKDWGVTNPWQHSYFAMGRLAPGVGVDQAKAVVRALGGRIDAQYPEAQAIQQGHPDANPARHWGAVATELNAVRVNDDVKRTMFILFGAVGVVLLIACANVANLFLVRASARRREIAVRLAIGAGRGRLIRQLLVESLLLSLLGGAASIVVAWAGVKGIALLQPAYALGTQSNAGIGTANFGVMSVNVTALVFTGVLAVTTGLLFGLMPALQATRPSLTETLKDDGGARQSRLRGLTGRNALTVAEIALAVMLLAGSGLLMHSLALLLGVRPGFDVEHVLTMRINRAPSWARDSLATFYDRSVSELATIPGVTDVAIADLPPANGGFNGTTVMLRDREPPPQGRDLHAGVHYITPAWPAALHVPLLRGRLFSRGDLPDTRKVVLVNETAARAWWPDEDPIGKPLSITEGNGIKDTAYVVGVLGDVRFASMDEPFVPDVYISYYQHPFSWRMMIFIRTTGDPSAYTAAARDVLRRAAPGFPVSDVRTMTDRMGMVMAPARFSALLLTLFASLALGLAMIGTYGVISFSVAQRTREIGVRVALGATSRDVVRLVLAQSIGLAAVGAVVGLAAAVATTRLLKSMLFGVEPTDPPTLVGIVGVLVLAVLVASWIPARRAAGVPAVQALRGD